MTGLERRTARRGRNRAPAVGGFTLTELVFVLAVIATLTLVLLPIGMNALKDADLARANGDIQGLAMSLTAFVVDLGRMPACDTNDCSSLVRGGPEQNNGLRFLAVGEGRGSLVDRYPAEAGTLTVKWSLAERGHRTNRAVNNAANHLAINDPNVDDLTTGLDYPRIGRSRWRGPYVRHLTLDPWGNAYIVSVGAMEKDGSPIVAGARGWILSAGPNGVLETAPDATDPGGDDLGTIVFEASAYGP